MTPAVKKWLLKQAKDELRGEKERLAEARRMVKEYEKRVTDPGWNIYTFADDGPPIAGRPGHYTWGSKVTEWKRHATISRKKVESLEQVIKELR